MTLEAERVAKLEANEINMSKQINEIKQDIKGIKNDIEDLKITIARYASGITVAWIIIELGIKFLLE